MNSSGAIHNPRHIKPQIHQTPDTSNPRNVKTPDKSNLRHNKPQTIELPTKPQINIPFHSAIEILFET